MVMDRHSKFLNIPPIYCRATLTKIPAECPHKEPLLRYIDKLADNIADGIGLLIHGKCSTGKSAAAAIILMKAAELRKGGLFISSSFLKSAVIQDLIFMRNISFATRAKDVDLLVIDEFIPRGDDRFDDTLVEEFVRYRIGQKKATIITTNVSQKTIRERCPALAEAMTESFYVLYFSGHNFREEKQKEISRRFHG